MKKPEVTSIEFRPAKGGVVSETRMRVKRGGSGGGPDYDHDSEIAVHPSVEHAAKHIRKMMGHCFGEEPEEE